LCVGSAVVTIVVQMAGNAMQPLRHLSLGVRLGNAIYSYAIYVEKTVWPVHLAVLYPHPLNSLTFGQTASALIFLAVVSVLVWSQRTIRPYALVGWLWFLGTLVPMIGIVQVGLQAMADRYAYIPTIGLFLILAWGISDFIEARAIHRGAVIATGIAALGGLSVLTSRQIGYWRSDEALWSHTLQVTRENFFANDKMGFALLEQGRPEAMDYFRAAAEIWPADYVSRGEIAAGLQDQGELRKAIQEYEAALQDGPDRESRARYYCNMAVIFRELGDSQRAKASFRTALNTDAEEVQAMIQQLSGWAARQPAAPNYWRLGLLLDGVDHSAEAKSAYERALQLDPNFLPARTALDRMQTTE
jgi:protein O-mannosyl-transferase